MVAVRPQGTCTTTDVAAALSILTPLRVNAATPVTLRAAALPATGTVPPFAATVVPVACTAGIVLFPEVDCTAGEVAFVPVSARTAEPFPPDTATTAAA